MKYSMSFSVWMRETIGPNWVVARKTPRLLRKYGDDAIFLSPQKYKRLAELYEAGPPTPSALTPR